MNDTSTSAQNVFSSSQQPETQSSHQTVKRRKIALQVAIEAGADGRPPVQEVFPDGTFTTIPDSHFERTSAAASAFVARALVNPSQPQNNATASDETRATSNDPNHQWAATAVTHIEASIWDLNRAIGVVDALFASTPLLRLQRVAPKSNPTNSINDGAALLMAKRRCLKNCADEISTHIKALNKWLKADNDFCDSFLMLRKRCHGVRRLHNGTPLVDVGDANFVAVRRPPPVPLTDSENNEVVSANDDTRPSNLPVLITYPASTFLKFSLHQVDTNQTISFSPVVQETPSQLEETSAKAVIRRIRLARVSAFRRIAFETLANQASSLRQTADLSSSSVTIDSGPSDLLRIEQTNRAENIPSIDIDLSTFQSNEEARKTQLAAILQTVAIHGTLIHRFSQEPMYPSTSSHSSASSVLDRLLNVTSTRRLLTRLESVLDLAVQKYRVRLDWTRGSSRTEETRVRIYSVPDDGDGSQRLLATIEPISSLNNAGHPDDNGHVRILPAFGVIIPAPDDPSIRGRAVAPHSSVSSSGNSAAPGLDDVPRAYICPVGSEILSLLTLLLCVRLLDSLETLARAGIDEMLDVDRQCFTVIVSSPTNGRVLKAKVWPQGDEVGNEVPGVNVWYNGQRIDGFSNPKVGRLTMWKKLLQKLVLDESPNSGDDAPLVKPKEGKFSSIPPSNRNGLPIPSSGAEVYNRPAPDQLVRVNSSQQLPPHSRSAPSSMLVGAPPNNVMQHAAAPPPATMPTNSRGLVTSAGIPSQYTYDQRRSNNDTSGFQFNI